MKRVFLMVALVLLGSSGAWALGTEAGTWIDNNATLTYSAGGVLQPEVKASTNSRGSADSFVVDKKIDMVLQTTDTDQVEVKPGQQDRITSYVLKNEGNAIQNFKFTVDNLVYNSNDPDASEADYNDKQDNEQVSNMEIEYKDSNGNWQSIPQNGLPVGIDATVEIRVKADIPTDDGNLPNDVADGKDGDIMNIELVATAVDSNGADENENENDSDTQDDSTTDIVFADGSTVQNGSDSDGLGDSYPSTIPNSSTNDGHKGDEDKDGKEVARSGYQIKTPVLSLKKKSCVYSDPVNDVSDKAKRIPGAFITYVFDIENNGHADATGITIIDKPLDDNLVYDDTNDIVDVYIDKDASSECSCNNGEVHGSTNDQGSGSAGSNTGNKNDREVKIESIDVAQNKHTCVSFRVEID